MEIRRIALMLLLAAGIGVPMAFAQVSTVIEGADLLWSGFSGPAQVASLAR